MFMHYFEEIQLLIDDNMVDKNMIIDLIGYYIGIFHRISEYHEDISDYDDERYWKYYLKFVKSIPEEFYLNVCSIRKNKTVFCGECCWTNYKA